MVVALPEPVEECRAVEVRFAAVGVGRGVFLGDELGRPAVHHARVAQQMAYLPAGAGRDRGPGARLFGRRREEPAFLGQGRDVLGDLHGGILPAGSAACGRARSAHVCVAFLAPYPSTAAPAASRATVVSATGSENQSARKPIAGGPSSIPP